MIFFFLKKKMRWEEDKKEVEDVFANKETNSMESHIKKWFYMTLHFLHC